MNKCFLKRDCVFVLVYLLLYIMVLYDIYLYIYIYKYISCLIINCFFFYIGLKCHFNYFVLYGYRHIYIYMKVYDRNVVNI